MSFKFNTNVIKLLADIHTPVELYLKVRDKFPGSFLLESSDYKSKENSFSYLCLDPVASFIVTQSQTRLKFPNDKIEILNTGEIDIAIQLHKFCMEFESEKLEYNFVTNGLFGYTTYDAIPLFEDISFKSSSDTYPLLQYHAFRFIIVFNHFNNELYLIEHLLEGETSDLTSILDIISNRSVTTFKFHSDALENSNLTDEQFLNIIQKGKKHCHLGNVFQIVLSRKYSKNFRGDEFNVYRALRSINPSPYLFYFDYGNFKIFGSSPEAQLMISNHTAIIHPIAGTFPRTGNAIEDERAAINLSNDPKENAEHIMLVDLARNDLSRNSENVQVESYKQIEYFSHVIHLVSKVKAELKKDYNPIKILGDTYPAGTLSGAPKYKAMQIIDEYEPDNRGFYGGTVGYIGFNGEFNHAIFIRSFISHRNQLTYQAGCGVVAKSIPESELQEVTNKLGALRKAIELAKTI